MRKFPEKKAKKVMVFGVFDRFHPGHESFLRQAAKYGKIIAVVARDSGVKKMKGRMPQESQRIRLNRLRKISHAWFAVLGDTKHGSYLVIKKYKPDIICLGYDQNLFRKDLEKKITRKLLPQIRLVQLAPYRSDKFHTSLQK